MDLADLGNIMSINVFTIKFKRHLCTTIKGDSINYRDF